MSTVPAAGLSCFTAALATYLDGGVPGAAERLARSLRLAVARDGDRLVFSHHRWSVADLPGGGRLGYAGAADAGDALAGLRAELDRHGRVVAVGNTAGMDWSPGTTAEGHWFVVDDRRGDRWHVRDEFEALLPGGEHRPFTGWLSTSDLGRAIAPRPAAGADQAARDRLAFGVAVPTPPPEHHWWLRHEPSASTVDGPPDGLCWVEDTDALRLLADVLLNEGEGEGEGQGHGHGDSNGEGHSTLAGYAPDVWAAARHRTYTLQILHDTHAPALAEAWRAVPMGLRFAVESARRGRVRTGHLRHALTTVITLETAASQEDDRAS